MREPEASDDGFATELARATSRSSDQSDRPSDAVRELLVGALAISGATRGRVYLLNLSTGRYESYAQISRGPESSAMRLADYSIQPVDALPPIERATVTLKPQVLSSPADYTGPSLPTSYASRLVLPIVRKKTCIGVIDLDSDQPGHFSDPITSMTDRLRPLLDLAELLYERRFLLELLRESQQPIRFTVHESEFYEQVMTLAALSSQMEFAALREYTEDKELRALEVYGFNAPREKFDIVDLTENVAFAEVVNDRRPHVAPNMRDGRIYGALTSRPEIGHVRSFVAVPVLVGSELFGMFSFGSSLEYDYSEAEVSGLMSIANGIGVAIHNFRNFQSAADQVHSYADIGMAITAVEVAQAARHEARGIIDDGMTELVTLRREVKTAVAGAKAVPINDRIDQVDEHLSSLNTVLDKIKAASKAPARERRLTSLRDIWDQARSQLTGKIGQARLEACRYDGPDVEIHVAVDWFRQVFINLLLNSLDAYSENSAKKRGRQIRLLVDRPAEREKEITLTYTDNAGGINPAALRGPDGGPVEVNAIFQPNVTSKPEGSGWGLALVRKILADHGGSISLVDYRGGTTFRIVIPKPSESAGKDDPHD